MTFNEQGVAASRFMQFLGATLVLVGFILSGEFEGLWYLIPLIIGWFIFFIGLWSKNVITKSIEKNNPSDKPVEKSGKS